MVYLKLLKCVDDLFADFWTGPCQKRTLCPHHKNLNHTKKEMLIRSPGWSKEIPDAKMTDTFKNRFIYLILQS